MRRAAKVEVVDIETLSNLFMVCTMDIKNRERRAFILHESRDDFSELIEWMKEPLTMIGYNNLDFDAQVLQWIWENRFGLDEATPGERAEMVYQYSQEVIQKKELKEFYDYWESQLKWKQVDLFKIWHFNNRAKATSLKWVQYMIDWKDVREMPIQHWETVQANQIEDILSYCWNDVESTLELFRITRGKTELSEYKGKDKIEFRQNIKKRIEKECINWNDVKIGAELNYVNYNKKTGISKKELKDSIIIRHEVNLKECIPEYISFENPQLQELLEKVKSRVIPIPVPQGYKFEYSVTIGTTKHIMKLGGLHSCEKPRILEPKPGQKLTDADVGGQYPAALAKRLLHPEHLEECWSEQIETNILERDELKPKAKKDKALAAYVEALKLANNGGAYGKLGEDTDWQYDPKCMYSVTLGCQFELLMLIERLEEAGISVVSSNTDGIVSLYDESLEEEYKRICTEWEAKVKAVKYGKLEFASYKKMVQLTVNDYIAVKDDGTVKKKGDFMTEFELHKNKSRRIVPLALEAYFVHGANPKKFIRGHANIFDFCIGIKAKGEAHYEARSFENGNYKVEKLQKIVRHYISNEGVKLLKCYSDGRENQCESGKWVSTIFNSYEERADYDINYDYYILDVYDKINRIIPEVTVNYTQLSMFV